MLGQNLATFARPPGGGGMGVTHPALDLNFLSGALDSRMTFARAGASNTATRFDAFGNLQGTSANVPRFDYGPGGGTTPIGLLLEETRTNSVRNPRAEGSANGSPGTLPTNWQNNNPAGLTQTVVGTGTENGITYIDIRVNGTTTSGGAVYLVRPESLTGVAASSGQIWTASWFVRMTAGSTANITALQVNMLALDSTPAQIGGALGQVVFTPTGAALATQRQVSLPGTMPATTASVVPQIVIAASSSVAIDITLRVGAPQLELGSFATSPILPVAGTPAATTRSAESLTMPTSGWYNASAGTFADEYTFNALCPSGVQQTITRADDGTAGVNNYAALYQGSTGNVTTSGASAGVSQGTSFLGGSPLVTFPAQGKVSLTYGATWHGSLNGAVAAALSPGNAAPASITRLCVGCRGSSNDWQINGYVKRIRYWNRILTDAELRQVTT